MSSARQKEISYEIPLKNPAGKLFLASIRIVLFKNRETQIPSDYVQKVEREIQFLWQYCPFRTDMELGEVLLNYLFSEMRFRHLHSFPFTKVRVVTKEKTYEMDKFRFSLETEKTKFGVVDPLLVTDEFGVYRLRVAPNMTIPQHKHHVMEEKEIILTDELLLNGKKVKAGTVNVWPFGTAHRYENPTHEEEAILCIDQPAFDANDEILI